MTLLRRALRKAARVARRAFGATATATPITAATVDLDAPQVALDPFPVYDVLRACGPVHFLAHHHAWLILGHAELRAAFAMPQLLSNQPYEDVDAVLLAADPPEHTAIRRIASKYFARDVIEALGRSARETSHELLQTRRLDVVSEFAEPLSERIAAQLIGFDARSAVSPAADFAQYIAGLRAQAHRATMYDRLRGDGFDEAQARSLVALFWVASTKTTERTIAACAYRLVTHDEILRELQRDPSSIEPFIDETLRLHPPEPMLRRMAKSAIDLGGTTIPAGAMVYLGLGAANRDPARYDDPHALRLDRSGSGHLAFGHGVHYCIGATVARVVIDAAVREMLGEGRTIRRVSEPTWRASMMVHYLERMEIET
jgi:cytochrome P450